jgi:hypothetical protein
MTDKTKMSNLESYQELTIQISTLNLKLDAILKLLNKPQEEYVINQLVTHTHLDARDPEITRVVNKAIAQLSDNENFEDSYK